MNDLSKMSNSDLKKLAGMVEEISSEELTYADISKLSREFVTSLASEMKKILSSDDKSTKAITTAVDKFASAQDKLLSQMLKLQVIQTEAVNSMCDRPMPEMPKMEPPVIHIPASTHVLEWTVTPHRDKWGQIENMTIKATV